MRLTSPWIPASIVVAISCFAWIGGITYLLVHFLELSNHMGWMIAASLALSTLLAWGFILYELRNAMELPDDLDPHRVDMFPVPVRKASPKTMASASERQTAAF
ncbi:MAG: hypothetical protein ABI162_05880 [Luteolibacter sp.]